MGAHPAIPNEQAALLAAVVAEPDDDTPRLVYADWLDEHGDPEQAAFVREAIELDRMEPGEDSRREELADRLDWTAEECGPRWLAAVGIEHAVASFDRGFPEAVGYEGFASFFQDRAALFAHAPLREVMITGQEDETDAGVFRELAAVPELARLRRLVLSNDGWPVSLGDWEAFIGSPYLSGLEHLGMSWAGLTDDHARALAAARTLAGVREIGLEGNQITARGALDLVRSTCLAGLTRLWLHSNPIPEDRRPGSLDRALVNALIDRFDNILALGR